MVKIKKIAAMVVIFVLLAGAAASFAETPVRADRSIVVNSLPDVKLYLETDMDYDLTEKNTEIYVNDEKTDLQKVRTFGGCREGAVYFFLVDISRSVKEEEMELIKEGILSFASLLSEDDKVFLIPFGEAVYSDKTAFTPSSEEFRSSVEALEVKDDYTQLYAAIDSVVGILETETKELPDRKIAMVFSDGADDTTGGVITKEEAIERMRDASVPLYAFAVGKDKNGKDELGLLSRSINGSLRELDENSKSTVFEQFKTCIDKTLVIETKVRNSEDIADTFGVRIMKDGQEFLSLENVKAHKSEDSKDVFTVALKKLFMTYWWIVALVVIAIIAAIVLHTIKKNKGVVNVDGRVVYGSHIQKKYHIKTAKKTKEITFSISINGGIEKQQKVLIENSLIVGRSSICDVYFDDETMSRQHFSLELSDEGMLISDLDSTGGTYLNGVKIFSRQKVSSGDVINAGRTKIRIM